MKLHRNAALSWSGRRLLARRVVEQGWTLTAAAEAAGVSVRCARKWVGRYRAAGEAGLVDRSSAPRRVANRTPAERVAVIVALAAAADDRGRDRRDARDAALDGLGGPAPQRASAGSAGSGSSRRSATSAHGRRARPHRRQEARSHQGGAGKRWRDGDAPALQRQRHRRRPATARHRRLGVRPRRGRRLQPPRLRRGARRRESRDRGRLPPPSARLLRPPRHHRRARSSPTTAPPTSRRSTPSPAAPSASATSALAPTARRPTAKPNASSAPCSTAGPTARSTAQATNAPAPLTAGSGTTTINDDTQPSATNPRSAEPTCLGLTASRAAETTAVRSIRRLAL